MSNFEEGDPRRNQPLSRRRVVAVAGTTITGALAGCSSDGDGGSNGGDDDDEDETESDPQSGTTGGESTAGETPTDTSAIGGNGSQRLESNVDGLELESAQPTDTGIEGRYPVTVTIRNSGDLEANVENYDYQYAVFDGSGNDVTEGTGGPTSDDPTVAPGETTMVLLTATVDGNPEDVAGFAVTLGCGSFDDGVYCGERSTETTTSDGGGGDTVGDALHTPTAADDHDWAAIADMEEDSRFDLPDEAPAYGWGYQRVGNEMTLFVPSFDSGTVYYVFVVEGEVSEVLVLESSFEGSEFVVGPDDSAYPMNAQDVSQLSIAWESDGGDLYVVTKYDENL